MPDRTRPPAFDGLLAAGFLVAGEIELLGLAVHGNPVWVDALAVGLLMTALAWRRVFPLPVAVLTALGIAVLAVHGDVQALNVPMVVLFVPPYTVARHLPQRQSLTGLLFCLVPPLLAALPTPQVGGLAFSLGMVGASWTIGRVVRVNGVRQLALRRRTTRAVAARDVVERLALADERSRIALELQDVVWARVGEMVTAADVASGLVVRSPSEVDTLMASVEVTAQQVLADVRRVLGVLRDDDESAALAPLPGIGQLSGLHGVDGRQLRLVVEGEPRLVTASVDLGVYRIVESAFADATGHPASEPLVVTLGYTRASLDVGLAIGGTVCAGWPTVSMREWAALCEAELDVDEREPGRQLFVSIPDPAEATVWAS
jgi:hypothetical protein